MSRVGAIPIGSLGFPIERPAAQQWLKTERRTLIWAGQFGDEPAIFKLYRHREPWHTLRCALTRYRVEREYRTMRHLGSHDVPCPEPLGWANGHCLEHGYFELLVMRRVPEAVDLQTLINNGHRPDVTDLFTLARSMHEAGVCSQVLCSRNMLVANSERTPRVMLIDFPRARIFPRSVVGTRVAKYDLVMLIKDLTGLGIEPSLSQITCYGITRKEARALTAAAAKRRGGKIARRLADAECRIHHVFASLNINYREGVTRHDN